MTRVESPGRQSGRSRLAPAFVLVLTGLVAAASAEGQSLRGSTASLDQQNRVAREHDFTYLRTPEQVRSFVSQGLLVPVKPNADFDLHAVSFPYARAEVALFVERLASQYRQACGEKMVVTSLTRPLSNQPSNASPRSVHPTGMALDLRRSNNARCRSWLENTLLQLEGTGVLDATRESNPPHYHVVLFPRQYVAYIDRLDTRVAQAVTLSASSASAGSASYTVRSGDSLWTIARRHGTTVERLQAENDLRTSRIYAGQVIVLPGR
jgi:LysM repeat protein